MSNYRVILGIIAVAFCLGLGISTMSPVVVAGPGPPPLSCEHFCSQTISWAGPACESPYCEIWKYWMDTEPCTVPNACESEFIGCGICF